MITLKPSPLPVAGSFPAANAQLSIHARLAAATEALLKTREQVVEALDHHLSELDTLRRALGPGDKSLLSVVPAMAASPAPEAKSFEMAPKPAAPLMPLMTQILWPAKHEEAAPVSVPLRPPSAALPISQAPPSSPMVAFPGTQEVRDHPVDPNLEKATLEELNAALAFAFNHVAKARPSSSPSNGGTPW